MPGGHRFLPGLTNLDVSAQIVGWAVVFGVVQEGITRQVDHRGREALTNVRGSMRPFQKYSERLTDEA